MDCVNAGIGNFISPCGSATVYCRPNTVMWTCHIVCRNMLAWKFKSKQNDLYQIYAWATGLPIPSAWTWPNSTSRKFHRGYFRRHFWSLDRCRGSSATNGEVRVRVPRVLELSFDTLRVSFEAEEWIAQISGSSFRKPTNNLQKKWMFRYRYGNSSKVSAFQR